MNIIMKNIFHVHGNIKVIIIALTMVVLSLMITACGQATP